MLELPLELRRLLAAVLLCALCASWGWRSGLAYAARPRDYTPYNSAQMSWIIEGIWERAAAEAARAGKAQQEKLAVEGLSPAE